MGMIYAAVVIFTLPSKTPGKRRIEHVLKAFSSKDEAKAYIDRCAEGMTDDAMRFKQGSVHTIEEVEE